MNPTPLTPDESHAGVFPKPESLRYFYSGTALVLLVLMFLGFQQYYLHGKAFPGRDIAPPLRTLVLLHATVMTAWVVLFLVQPLLIARGSYRVHMAVGRFGAVLAACIVVLGLMIGIQGTMATPPEVRIWGVTPRQFMAVPVVSVVIFGVFVAVGVYFRRRPEIHRPMMLMATLIVIPAAVARIGPLNALYEDSVLQRIFGPFLWTLVLATLLVVIRWLGTRSVGRWFAIVYGCLVVSSLLIWWTATTAAWDRFATLLL